MKSVKGKLLTTLVLVMSLLGLVACGGDATPSPTPTTGSAATATSAATSTPEGDSWQTYTSTEGRFSASFPGEPSESNQTANTELGEIVNYFVKHENGSTQYMVSYADYPNEAMSGSDPKEVLADSFSKTFESSPDTNKVVSKSEITIEGYPAIEGEIEYTSGNYVWYRQFLVGDRMYQLLATALTADKDELADEAEKFHESFKLTGTGSSGDNATPTTGASLGMPEGWQEFTSSAGKFTVLMPGEPTESESTSQTAIGDLTQHLFQYSKDGPEFVVAYADYPDQASEADPVKLLEDTITGAAQGSTVQNQVASTLQGNASVSGEWEAGDGSAYTFYKAILVEDRLYQMAVATSMEGKAIFEPQARAFIESFQLNP